MSRRTVVDEALLDSAMSEDPDRCERRRQRIDASERTRRENLAIVVEGLRKSNDRLLASVFGIPTPPPPKPPKCACGRTKRPFADRCGPDCPGPDARDGGTTLVTTGGGR